MKTLKLGLFVAWLAFSITSQAITNTAIAVSGTNVILSWPSLGYESYLIQYRETLNATDSWTSVANAYPANSTNRTTFTIAANIASGGVGGGTNGGGSINPDGTNTVSDGTITNATQSGTGFFRVFHIPDWLVDVSGSTFGGPTFIPVDFATPDAPTNLVEYTTLLLNSLSK